MISRTTRFLNGGCFDSGSRAAYTVRMKHICILGATGSIGQQTLEIIAAFPDRFSVDSLSANSQVELLAKQARRFHARVAVIMQADLLPALRDALAGSDTIAQVGMSALEEIAASPKK